MYYLLFSVFADQMNVCWHRPRQKEFSLYVHNVQNVKPWDRRVCHLLATPQWWSCHACKHLGRDTGSVPIHPHLNVKMSQIHQPPPCQSQRSAKRRRALGARVCLSLCGNILSQKHLCVWQNHSTQIIIIILITVHTEGWDRGCI